MKSKATRSQASRANAKRGLLFERYLKNTFTVLNMTGVARIEKTDPPVKSGGGKIVRLANPWLDYAGVHRGRMVILEAKLTDADRLPICLERGGVTAKQLENMETWEKRGADVNLLWGRILETGKLDVCMVPVGHLLQAKWDGHRSIKWPGDNSPFHLLWKIFTDPALKTS